MQLATLIAAIVSPILVVLATEFLRLRSRHEVYMQHVWPRAADAYRDVLVALWDESLAVARVHATLIKLPIVGDEAVKSAVLDRRSVKAKINTVLSVNLAYLSEEFRSGAVSAAGRMSIVFNQLLMHIHSGTTPSESLMDEVHSDMRSLLALAQEDLGTTRMLNRLRKLFGHKTPREAPQFNPGELLKAEQDLAEVLGGERSI